MEKLAAILALLADDDTSTVVKPGLVTISQESVVRAQVVGLKDGLSWMGIYDANGAFGVQITVTPIGSLSTTFNGASGFTGEIPWIKPDGSMGTLTVRAGWIIGAA